MSDYFVIMKQVKIMARKKVLEKIDLKNIDPYKYENEYFEIMGDTAKTIFSLYLRTVHLSIFNC